MMNKLLFFLLPCIFAFAGCASVPEVVWTSDPSIQSVNTDKYSIRFEPIKESGNFFEFFRLTIVNKSNQNILLDWNNTLYLHQGRENGKFGFAGIDPQAVQEGTVPPDTITPGDTLSRNIVPLKLIAFAPLSARNMKDRGAGIGGGIIPAGKNGARLAMDLDGRKINREIALQITQTEKNN